MESKRFLSLKKAESQSGSPADESSHNFVLGNLKQQIGILNRKIKEVESGTVL
jgi:hypothetical protein